MEMERWWSCCSNEEFEKYYEDIQSTFCIANQPQWYNYNPYIVLITANIMRTTKIIIPEQDSKSY